MRPENDRVPVCMRVSRDCISAGAMVVRSVVNMSENKLSLAKVAAIVKEDIRTVKVLDASAQAFTDTDDLR